MELDEQVLGGEAELEALANGTAEEVVTDEVTEETTPQQPNEFEINYRGKLEKHPLEKILQFAQQGRDYSEKMGAWKSERTQLLDFKTRWEQAQKDLSRLKEYDEVNQYIQKDPQWWEYVRSNYQNRLKEQGQQATLPPEVQEKLEKVDKFEQFITAQEQAKEDSELDGYINQVREQHPDLDWKTLDENGLDLERRVTDHAIKLGIKTAQGWKAAFFDLMAPDLVNRAKLGGKEEVGKQIQKATKLGLGPVTDKPTQKVKRVQNVSDKSWEDITREAMEAIG